MPPTTNSSITVPITIPLHILDTLVNEEIPCAFSSDPNVQDDIIDITTSWNLNRSNISLSATDKALSGNTTLKGKAKIRGHAGRASVSEDINLRGEVSLAFQPKLGENWQIIPQDLTLDYELEKAQINLSVVRHVVKPVTKVVKEIIDWIPFVGKKISETIETVEEEVEEATTIPISVRTIVRKYLDPKFVKYKDELPKKISNLGEIRNIAEKTWEKLCLSVPIGEGLWLETRPVQFRSAHPSLHGDFIRMQLGLNIETRILSDKTEPICPFNENLLIESQRSASMVIALPAKINYDTVETGLEALVVGKSFGDVTTVSVEALSLQSYPKTLLMKLDVTIGNGGWFNKRASGYLYVWAEPRLSNDKTSIMLHNVRLDTDSRNALIAIFGEISEPLFLSALKSYSFNLNPIYNRLKSKANETMDALSSSENNIDGQIMEVYIDTLDLGPKHLHLVGMARGLIAIKLQSMSSVAKTNEDSICP